MSFDNLQWKTTVRLQPSNRFITTFSFRKARSMMNHRSRRLATMFQLPIWLILKSLQQVPQLDWAKSMSNISSVLLTFWLIKRTPTQQIVLTEKLFAGALWIMCLRTHLPRRQKAQLLLCRHDLHRRSMREWIFPAHQRTRTRCFRLALLHPTCSISNRATNGQTRMQAESAIRLTGMHRRFLRRPARRPSARPRRQANRLWLRLQHQTEPLRRCQHERNGRLSSSKWSV